MYCTADAEHFLEDLDELPCACPACAGPREEFTRGLRRAEHNVNALRAELRRVRERIRAGRLRDYIEGQTRHEQWLTAAFREFDDQWGGYVEERTPLMRDAEVTAATAETLDRVEIRRFADRVTSRYQNRFTDQPLVLVPCSATKPYSDSQSHGQFHDAIQWRGHTVSMTSPIGVVPQELETTYPAQHYDAVVTGDWSEDEIGFVAEVLRRYLERNDYSRVVAHVPEDGYREICERVESDPAIDVSFEYTCVGHPTSDESLGELNAALQGEPAYSKREREHNTVRALADYLLGDGAGDDLFGGPGEADIRTTGRYPKLQVWGRRPRRRPRGRAGRTARDDGAAVWHPLLYSPPARAAGPRATLPPSGSRSTRSSRTAPSWRPASSTRTTIFASATRSSSRDRRRSRSVAPRCPARRWSSRRAASPARSGTSTRRSDYRRRLPHLIQ